MKISAILATYNEEKNIKDCLESIKWVDEIIIVDGKSQDKTVQIAKKYTKKIFLRDNNPLMFHINKQKAIEKATSDWILYMDADERVDEDLKKEILKAISFKEFNGYWIPRKNIIFGKWIKNSFWYPDYQLRLFRRGKAYLPCKSVHEQPELTGKSDYLKNHLIHINYRTIYQYVRKINDSYSENDKNLFLAKNQKIKAIDVLRIPGKDFLSTYFARGAYKDGFHGLVLSVLQAFSSFVTVAKIWESEGFPEENNTGLVDDVKKYFESFLGEIRYWVADAKLKTEKSLFGKLLFRIYRKINS